MSTVDLSEIQYDALVEIFNIGVGNAAAAMSRMVDEEITLSVPSIRFETRSRAARMLGGGYAQSICSVSQRFDGSFSAEALLMFPEDKSLEIVRLMVGDIIPIEELSDSEQEALCEIGNIILNACVGSLADVFEHEFIGSLPVFHTGTSEEILRKTGKPDSNLVMLLHIDFVLERHSIRGYVAFLLDVSSVEGLKRSIDHFLGALTF